MSEEIGAPEVNEAWSMLQVFTAGWNARAKYHTADHDDMMLQFQRWYEDTHGI